MKSVASNFKFKHGFAQVVSNIVQPVIVTIPVFVIINYFAAGGTNFLISTFICLLFGTFLPLIAALMWIKSKNLDLDVSDKDERTFPLLFGALSYIIGIIMLFIAGAPAVAAILVLSHKYNTDHICNLFLENQCALHGNCRASSSYNLYIWISWTFIWISSYYGYVEPCLS